MRARFLLLLFACLVVKPVASEAADSRVGRLLRVSLLEGDVTFQRNDLERWVDLSINTPILEADKVWVGRGGKAEIEFENGAFARLSENTIVEFSRLAELESREEVEVRLVQGLASFEMRAAPAFAVRTPLFSARLKDAASFRVEVETDGSGRLVVFDGKLEVSGPSAQLFVQKGELVRFLSHDPDRYYLETHYVKDSWDQWVDERQDYLATTVSDRFHYGDRGWTTADLYRHGNWHDVPTYGRIWRPSAVAVDWVPFRSGRWVWYSSLGWTWVSYEPWGWIPYHYGRWANVTGYGWSWVPGPRYVSWCPGAVNWVQGANWVGWVPLGPHEPWYGHGIGGVNVFVSKNFGHRGSVTYLPHDSFVNGTPAYGFRSPRNPYTDGRIIAGQPRIAPTPASRMPLAGGSTARVFTNADLEARRNLHERILSAGRNPGSQNPTAEMERLRQERRRANTGSGFTSSMPSAGVPGIRTIPSVPATTPSARAGTRTYDNWSGGSNMRSEQRQRIYRLDSPGSGADGKLEHRRGPANWARPAPQMPQPSVDLQPERATDINNRQRVYEIYRGRAESGRTDRYSPPDIHRQPPHTRYYTPPSPPPAVSNPAGPPASYNGPAVMPVGPPAGYQGQPVSRESTARSHSRHADSGASTQESRGAVRGRVGR